MNIKKLKPTSPGTRHQILIEKNNLCRNNNLLKNKISGLKNNAGHSTKTGHTTVWHKGGGCKKKYRYLNNLQTQNLSFFIILAILYDPNRNSFIALRFNFNNCFFDFVIYTKYISIGTLLENKNRIDDFVKIGYFLELKNIPTGTIIHSLSKKNKNIYARSAGTFCQIIQKTYNKSTIKLPSGKILNFNLNLYGTIGSIDNEFHNVKVLGKAGKSRYLNIRPTVRGVAMNPVDHPHGGRTKGGRPSVSPWGKLTKGVPTVKKKYV